MSLIIDMHDGVNHVGQLVIRRMVYLNLADKAAIADKVSPYQVTMNGRTIGTVEHRYGDGPWVLLRKALEAAT